MNANLSWITKTLWTFLVRNMSKTFRNTVNSMVDGEKHNGLELWRVLYIANEGGSREVEVADLGALHDFPACTNGADLPQFLGTWVALAHEQGGDLPA